MATITRKRSAFSVFKSSQSELTDKGKSHAEYSTLDVATSNSSVCNERKFTVKEKKRLRRGSLQNVNSIEQENFMETPTNIERKPRRAQTCKSEPRLQSLRKSLKRKKRNHVKQDESATVGSNNSRESKKEQSDANVSISPVKDPICQVQMQSSENLRQCSDTTDKMPSGSEEVLNWLIKPIDKKKFFSDVWEKKPLLIKRRQPTYNDGLFNTKDLDCILREKDVKFGVNLDITSYRNGRRETHNPNGRAHPPVVWEFFKQGCSVRMLNPQSFSESVWKLTSVLQEYFGAFVGANLYLTPAGSQGFAPHYDDIEAFIIQLEGQKQWKLYSPRTVTEALPKYSSDNFSQEDIGEPILDKILEPGDCLYFPRGFIHQATTTDSSHSLHITLSVYQKNTWGDFLEKLLPVALHIAMEEDIEFRRGLPIGYLNHVGVANSEKASTERSNFLKRIQQLIMKLATYAPVDATADQMAIDGMNDMLPPLLSEDETMCSVHGNGAFWDNGRVCGEAKLTPDSEIRIMRPNTVRLAIEGDKALIYHTMQNSRVFHEVPPQSIEVSIEEADAIEYLLSSYPSFVSIDSVPLKSNKDKLNFVKRLYDQGILRTRSPLIQDSVV